MLRRLAIFIVLLFSMGLGGCRPRIINQGAERGGIVCFGDSITEGVGASWEESYPAFLEQWMGEPVHNAGVSGDTSADALLRLQSDVLELRPKVVIVILGGNDFLKKRPLEETIQNIDEIVQRIQASGAMVVLGAVKINPIQDPYVSAIKDLARERKALFIGDVMKGILFNMKYKSDQIHPNADGYKIIAERIFKQIKPYL